MMISFSKPKGRPVLTCTRADGTRTFTKSPHGAFFAAHDLMHYAVETTLGLRESFYGLIGAGRSISSFNEPGASGTLPPEAIITEHIVNLLSQEQAAGDPLDAERFNTTLREAIAASKTPLPAPPILGEDQLRRIRERFAELVHRFPSMPPEGTLDLPFP